MNASQDREEKSKERSEAPNRSPRVSGSVTDVPGSLQDRRGGQGPHSRSASRASSSSVTAPVRAARSLCGKAVSFNVGVERIFPLQPFSAHREDRDREPGHRSPRSPLLPPRPSGEGGARQGSEGQLSSASPRLGAVDARSTIARAHREVALGRSRLCASSPAWVARTPDPGKKVGARVDSLLGLRRRPFAEPGGEAARTARRHEHALSSHCAG